KHSFNRARYLIYHRPQQQQQQQQQLQQQLLPPPPQQSQPQQQPVQHEPAITPISDSGSGSKFSTFGNKQPSTAGVQMRRTTNKRGKTAPAPPKRTSLLSSSRDSTYRDDDNCKLGEGEQNANGTAIPITKSSSCSSFLIDKLFRGFSRDMANLMNRATDSENEQTEVTPDTDTDNPEPLGFQKTPQQSSFKRAPIMGNRGLETRSSKRLPQQARRDQLPPGSGGQPCTPVLGSGQSPIVGALEVQNVKKAINRYEPPPPPMAAANAISNSILAHRNAAAVKTQPQMIRSNSSSGVTMSNSATASLSKLQRHRTTTDGSMMTFSSFRGSVGNNSPKRAVQPTLADLEFPPPPVDLPPPPEEFDMPLNQRGGEGGGSSMMEKSMAPSNDVRNTEPSVEEASSRFGVSLRKREPSTDSCSSLGSPADAMINTMGDPPSLPIPPPPPAKDLKADTKRITNVPKCLQGETTMGKKSVGPLHGTSDPASQLVNELAESMHLPKAPSPLSAAQEPQQPISHYKSSDVSSLRKPVTMSKSTILPSVNASASDNYSAATNTASGVLQPPFKAQLKKVDTAKRTAAQPAKKEESTGGIIDFKSRLRKVDQNNAEVSSNGSNVGGDTNEPGATTVDNNNKHQSGNSPQSIHNNNNINTTISSNSNGNILNNNDNSASSSSSENENHRSAKKGEMVVRNGTGIPSKNNMDSSNKLLLENNELNSLKLKKTNVTSTIVTGSAPIDSNKVIELKKTEIKIELSDDRKRESLEGNSLKVDSGGGSGDNLSTGSSGAGGEEGDGKRKSTGSISSLKKLWEAKESPSDPLSAQLSPKLGTKSVANMVPKMNNNMEAEDGSVGSGGQDSSQQQQEQLQHMSTTAPTACVSTSTLGNNKKPAVPMKPSKFSSIYATPVQNMMQTATSATASSGSGGGASTTSTIYAKSNECSGSIQQPSDKSSSASGASSVAAGGRDNILELVQAMQTSLKQPVSNISASQWLALSDRLSSLQSSCVAFADNESLPPHAKFHFRELVTRVENQARSLRSASNKNVQDNEKLVQEVGQSLKQISNALHR
uniref:F-actin binding domain-containing protein n=1 Tax=Anopheles epiroticus TaxID=199890 RepID=A0A182PUQ0_9DIPT